MFADLYLRRGIADIFIVDHAIENDVAAQLAVLPRRQMLGGSFRRETVADNLTDDVSIHPVCPAMVTGVFQLTK